VLYVWEFCYRVKFGWPLLLHHLVTLLLIQLSLASFFDAHHILHAFVSPFCLGYLYPEWHGILFYGAAAQAFVLKTIVTIVITGCVIVTLYVSDDLNDVTSNWKLF
jgi:hypothetical protein